MKRIVLTLVVVLALSVSALAGASQASAATSISGAVTANGYRQPGVFIYVYRQAPGSPWEYSGVTTQTDAEGRYSVSGLSNWFYYQVLAHGVFGKCNIGVPVQIWQGWSQPLWATGGPRGANIAMSHVNSIYC
jgi:hypothetical protein